jgi:hypothetical protein
VDIVESSDDEDNSDSDDASDALTRSVVSPSNSSSAGAGAAAGRTPNAAAGAESIDVNRTLADEEIHQAAADADSKLKARMCHASTGSRSFIDPALLSLEPIVLFLFRLS